MYVGFIWMFRSVYDVVGDLMTMWLRFLQMLREMGDFGRDTSDVDDCNRCLLREILPVN